jgi:PAS domain-containing protein
MRLHKLAVNALKTIYLSNTWPLWEQGKHFELGYVINSVVTDLLQPSQIGELGLHHAACWECDLSDNSLVWSGGVYDIFGLPRWTKVQREEAVALYCEESRAIMERLRSYAIKHRRGFTVDVEIQPAGGRKRWMRLIAAPECINGRAVRLHGLKLAL